MRTPSESKGFTLTELAVAVGVIGLLASLLTAAVLPALKKGRDVKRKSDVAQIGKFLAARGCYVPEGGPGTYDLADLAGELSAKFPQYGASLTALPHDPRGGTDAETKYRYEVTSDGKKCVLYANLEYVHENVTLGALTDPTPGGGVGVLNGVTKGLNGTTRYFQVTN